MAPTAPIRLAHAPSLRRRVRGGLAWLHLWIGLVAGFAFVVLGLSGSVLTFHTELLLAAEPGLAQERPVVDGRVLARIVAEQSPQGLRSLDLPRASMPAWQGYFADGSRRYFGTDDGALLLTRTSDNDWLLWLHELHTHFLAGDTGKEAVGIAGWLACFMLLSGLYLWWPRLGQWWAQLRPHAHPPVRRWLTWHRSAGAITLPLLLLVTVCGVGMVYSQGARALLTGLFGGGSLPKPPVLEAGRQETIDWSRMVQSARSGLPRAELTRVSVPHGGVVGFRARSAGEWHPVGRSQVFVDARDGRVLGAYDAAGQAPGARASEALYPLHIGAVAGPLYRWSVAFAGLLPAFLFVTGVLFWYRRRAARRAVAGLTTARAPAST